MKPPKRGAGGVKPPSLDNFCVYIAYVPPPPTKKTHSQRVPLDCRVFSDFDSPRPKPPVPTCGPPSLLVGNKSFPYHFIETEA